MKKKYQLDGLDCAACALKVERKVSALPFVDECCVNFATQTLTAYVMSEYPTADTDIAKACKRVVRGLTVTPK